MAWAMPQAIERSVATPTMRARFPARKPIRKASGRWLTATGGYADRELLARLDRAALTDVVPVGNLRRRDLEHARDGRQRIAGSHDVRDGTSRGRRVRARELRAAR